MLVDAICTFLQTQGIGTFGGSSGNLFAHSLPDTPDIATAIYATGGQQTEQVSGGGAGGAVLEYPTIQIVCRSAKRAEVATAVQDAYNKAYTIYQTLDGAGGLTLGGISYQFIRAMQQPYSFRVDGNDRMSFACNYRISKRLG